MSGADELQQILRPSETIVWQGRPVPGFILSPNSIFQALFGLLITVFAAFMMSPAPASGSVSWLICAPLFVFGLLCIGAGTVWVPFMHKRTWYTLTNTRAIIAADIPFRGRSLKFYSISDQCTPKLKKRAISSVYFATEARRTDEGRYTIPIGFENIPDAPQVYTLMRTIQSKAQAKGTTA